MDSHDPNEQLLQAVRAGNLSLVDQILQHQSVLRSGSLSSDQDLNLNYQTGGGRTMLFEAVSYPHNTDIFAHLLNRGYSIKGRDFCGLTLLHLAVQNYPAEIVHKLIKRGADINAYDMKDRRPLHFAALEGDLEIVCLLLYYGADVNGKANWAFLQAVQQVSLKPPKKPEVAKVLFPHIDLELSDLSYMSRYGTTTLYMAVKHKSPVALEILNIVDVENEQCEELLELALRYDTAEVFKTMWNLFGDRVVIIPSFIVSFFNCCKFLSEEWLEVVYVLLNSPRIKNIYKPSFINELNKNGFMHKMLNCLSERDIKPDIRLDIITFFVSLGVQICVNCLNFVHISFSFKDELRFLIFTYNYEERVMPRQIHYELRPLFALEFKRDIMYKNFLTLEMDVLWRPLTRFAPDIAHYLEIPKQIPKVPSLLEASRNEVMRAAKSTYNMTKAYQYLEFVEKSNLPPLIKDILLFKIDID